MKTRLFHYALPAQLVAQRPLAQRDASRMLVLDRKTGRLAHSRVKDLPQWLLPGDLLVRNETKVIPARLFAVKPETRARIEVFLLRRTGAGNAEWEALLSPAKRIKGPLTLQIQPRGQLEVLENLGTGHFLVRFSKTGPFQAFLKSAGHIPLPPYIKRQDETADWSRYQTLFAKKEGSVAAPTAGLHFTPELFKALKGRGVQTAPVTLHVGLGTFLGVTAADTEDHVMHPEVFEVPAATAKAVEGTRRGGGRVVALGTTVARTLESAWTPEGLQAQKGETRLFITPGYEFKGVDALFTNFHQPESTLLMMVSAFAGRERVLAAYEEAIREKYRFFSYGDAMLIL
ncbi:MAG TPA: tRNA preQ1(34) S-adenosylmethionine ribosyltransferase-isomerase QueA [bacterium]|nr:tRNA preQ1(34) S-adenosylmethionine ribosyltransferase-isomerase QueA [bacterium]